MVRAEGGGLLLLLLLLPPSTHSSQRGAPTRPPTPPPLLQSVFAACAHETRVVTVIDRDSDWACGPC